ncbi:MAG: radical SAM protein [Acidobacteriota bacterium]
MKIKETNSKKILNRSKIEGVDYCINPYIGCFHGCKYCYAEFMKKYTFHTENWGEFVDIKINSPELLEKEIKSMRKGLIMISSVTDPYQPIEKKYEITKRILEILLIYQFPVEILTKSSLILRDIEILKKFNDLCVGLTITTDNEYIKKIFEPRSSSISERVNTIEILHKNGIRTFCFVGPILPMNPENLLNMIIDKVDFIYLDRMNYCNKVTSIYKKYGLAKYLSDEYFENVKNFFLKNVDIKKIEAFI